jgi:Starch binding domain
VQGHARRGLIQQLLRRSSAPPTTAAVAARSRSPLVVAASAPAVPIKFHVEYRTEFGQVLKVVGAGESLGEWDPKHAPGKIFIIFFICLNFLQVFIQILSIF